MFKPAIMLKRIPFHYRITLLYVFFGASWILFSDKLVGYLTDDINKIQHLSIYKGMLFILVTGLLLYSLVRKELKRRNLIYQELLEAKKKAEESDRLKTNFLSNLSHYIRTPMNGILGFVELLEDKDTSQENHQMFLTYISEMSQNLLQTLNSIIEISKIQEGQAKINSESFRINELIERIVETARIVITEKNRLVSVKTVNQLPNGDDTIHSDREKINQVLSSLVANSVIFTEKGEIEIGYSKDNNRLLVWVKDTGKGISDEKIEQLFNGFLNNNSTTYTIGEGAGLGLSLSAGLVKLLGGELWLDSTGTQGTKFCFTVPVNQS
jgi:signal transduction histidine kinase